MNKFNFFKTTMPKSRKADFYLGCLTGSVFIDFNRLEKDQISLVRISFDGYGCCDLDEETKNLSKKDSTLFINEMDNEHLNQKIITGLVKKIISLNKERIWNDALEEYELLTL